MREYHKVFGGTRFYDRKEIRDAIAYLRLVVNPQDDISLKRIINVPKRSIGDSTLGTLEKPLEIEMCPILRAVRFARHSIIKTAKMRAELR